MQTLNNAATVPLTEYQDSEIGHAPPEFSSRPGERRQLLLMFGERLHHLMGMPTSVCSHTAFSLMLRGSPANG